MLTIYNKKKYVVHDNSEIFYILKENSRRKNSENVNINLKSP